MLLQLTVGMWGGGAEGNVLSHLNCAVVKGRFGLGVGGELCGVVYGKTGERVGNGLANRHVQMSLTVMKAHDEQMYSSTGS